MNDKTYMFLVYSWFEFIAVWNSDLDFLLGASILSPA